jgi:hypothetical protein
MNSFLSAAAVSLVLWSASFIYFRFFIAGRTSSRRILSDFRDEVEKLVAEIDAATDRDLQLVEDRMKALRALLDETDKRLGTMRREIERRSSEERAYAELGRKARQPSLYAADEKSAPAAALASAVPASPAAPAPAPAPAPAQAPAPQPPQDTVRSPTAPHPSPEKESAEARFMRAQMQVAPKEPPFAERAAELHRAGFSSELIANRLGKTVGEVDLAIALSVRMEGRDGDDTGH